MPPIIQRNWELQFIGVENNKNLKNWLFKNELLNDIIPSSMVNQLYQNFLVGNKVILSHPISMLLTLSVWCKKFWKKKIKLAIYSGKIPGPNFIENLIKLVGDNYINIYLFGSGRYVKYKNPNIKSYYTPQGKIKIILFVFFQLLSLFIFHPKKLYKLLINYSVILNYGSVFLSLSKILPVLNHTPDIFHIQWAKSLPFWFFLKQIYGIKIILSLRGSHINYSPYADKKLAKQYETLFPKVDKMHAVSKKISLKAIQFGAKEDRIESIYSALDVNLLKTFEKTEYSTHEPFRFLSVGRFHWVKGYQYSIKAIAGLKSLNRKIHYTIVANNNISEEILYQIDELSLHE